MILVLDDATCDILMEVLSKHTKGQDFAINFKVSLI
jgi:hypothetical protein